MKMMEDAGSSDVGTMSMMEVRYEISRNRPNTIKFQSQVNPLSALNSSKGVPV